MNEFARLPSRSLPIPAVVAVAPAYAAGPADYCGAAPGLGLPARISPKLCASAISRSASATTAANRSAARPRRPLISCATRPRCGSG